MLALEVEGFRGRAENRRNMAAFWLLGLLNNSAYVVMLAGANSISSSAVGLVFLCAVLPGICLKASAPYWFHRVRYATRVLAAAALMAAAYTTVALSTRRPFQLAGVVLASLQGSLGEASCLALTSRYSSQAAITMWSSGTGFAGVFGFAWVASLHVLAGWTFKATLLAANAMAAAWLAVYFALLEPPEAAEWRLSKLVAADEALVVSAMDAMAGGECRGNDGGSSDGSTGGGSVSGDEGAELLGSAVQEISGDGPAARGDASGGAGRREKAPRRAAVAAMAVGGHLGQQRSRAVLSMGLGERLLRTAVLWPYTVPLLVVYFAEYAMQSGAWAAIGFPVTDAAARQRFYLASNWTYQAGVFVSRSSGLAWQAGRGALWAMPVLQLGWLAFFLADGVYHVWYNWGLLLPCFVVGLLGGAVYVNAFMLIAREVQPQYREFSLAAASVADSVGVALADVAGVLIQGCLFKANGLVGADYSC